MSIPAITDQIGHLASSFSDDRGSGLSAAAQGGASFGDMLSSAIGQVNALQTAAQQSASDYALGKVSDIHSVMIAAQKASIALSLTTQVRNQVVSAYQTVMQTTM